MKGHSPAGQWRGPRFPHNPRKALVCLLPSPSLIGGRAHRSHGQAGAAAVADGFPVGLLADLSYS